MDTEYPELKSSSFSSVSARKRKFTPRVTDEMNETENVINYTNFHIAFFFAMTPTAKCLSVFQRNVLPTSSTLIMEKTYSYFSLTLATTYHTM